MKKSYILLLTLLLCVGLAGCCLSHEWQEADCLTPKTCTKCGETEGEALGHSWAEATCTAPKTCTTCGETEGAALGHSWNDADCMHPTTCSLCGETEGEPLAHTWEEVSSEEPDYCSSCGINACEAGKHVNTLTLTVTEEGVVGTDTCDFCQESTDTPYADWSAFLKAHLPGKWMGVVLMVGDDMYNHDDEFCYLEFSEDGNCTVSLSEAFNGQGAWSFSGYFDGDDGDGLVQIGTTQSSLLPVVNMVKSTPNILFGYVESDGLTIAFVKTS